jgi:hypothetical protein
VASAAVLKKEEEAAALPDHFEQVGHEDEDVGALPDVVDVDAGQQLVQEPGKEGEETDMGSMI